MEWSRISYDASAHLFPNSLCVYVGMHDYTCIILMNVTVNFGDCLSKARFSSFPTRFPSRFILYSITSFSHKRMGLLFCGAFVHWAFHVGGVSFTSGSSPYPFLLMLSSLSHEFHSELQWNVFSSTTKKFCFKCFLFYNFIKCLFLSISKCLIYSSNIVNFIGLQ